MANQQSCCCQHCGKHAEQDRQAKADGTEYHEAADSEMSGETRVVLALIYRAPPWSTPAARARAGCGSTSASSPATATASAPSSAGVRFTRDLRRERTFPIDDLPTAADAYGDTAEPDHPADNTV